MAVRLFSILRCRCGFSIGGFGRQPERCPRCRRGLKRTTHKIPGFVRAGTRVHYSSVIGKEPTIRDCYITSDVYLLGDTPCVMLDQKRGAVAVEALTEARA